MSETRIQVLEELVAHLSQTVDELSDVVADQARDLEIAKRRLAMVMEREAERELDGGGSVPLADAPPPHY